MESHQKLLQKDIKLDALLERNICLQAFMGGTGIESCIYYKIKLPIFFVSILFINVSNYEDRPALLE